MNEKFSDPRIAGALFDFLGFLTTRPKRVVIGSDISVYRPMELLREWADSRQFNLDDADVKGWTASRAPLTGGEDA